MFLNAVMYLFMTFRSRISAILLKETRSTNKLTDLETIEVEIENLDSNKSNRTLREMIIGLRYKVSHLL